MSDKVKLKWDSVKISDTNIDRSCKILSLAYEQYDLQRTLDMDTRIYELLGKEIKEDDKYRTNIKNRINEIKKELDEYNN